MFKSILSARSLRLCDGPSIFVALFPIDRDRADAEAQASTRALHPTILVAQGLAVVPVPDSGTVDFTEFRSRASRRAILDARMGAGADRRRVLS
jgi:hypothetical protein